MIALLDENMLFLLLNNSEDFPSEYVWPSSIGSKISVPVFSGHQNGVVWYGIRILAGDLTQNWYKTERKYHRPQLSLLSQQQIGVCLRSCHLTPLSRGDTLAVLNDILVESDINLAGTLGRYQPLVAVGRRCQCWYLMFWHIILEVMVDNWDTCSLTSHYGSLGIRIGAVGVGGIRRVVVNQVERSNPPLAHNMEYMGFYLARLDHELLEVTTVKSSW